MKRRHQIYLDYNATTPVCAKVIDRLSSDAQDLWLNASSSYGKPSAELLPFVKNKILKVVCPSLSDSDLDCSKQQSGVDVVFTSGASEANVTVITAVAHSSCGSQGKLPLVVTSKLEHDSILDTLSYFERIGMIGVYWLPVLGTGVIDLTNLRQTDMLDCLSDRPFILGCLMLANNETGVIQPVAEFSELLRKRATESRSSRIIIHSDISQAVGKIPVDVNDLHVDTCSLTGHKFYAPKGVGCLVINSELARTLIREHPLIHGGGQQNHLRSGTESLTLISSLAHAIDDLKR